MKSDRGPRALFANISLGEDDVMKRDSLAMAALIVGGLCVVGSMSWAQPPAIISNPEPGSPYRTSVQITPSTPVQAARQPLSQIQLQNCEIKLYDEVQIAAERAGVLDMVALEGQLVKQGSLLAHTRDDIVKAALAVATRQANNDVEIRYARKASELAQVEYERDLQANGIVKGTVSDLTIRAHRLAAEKALLQMEQAETSLEIEKLKRNETVELLRLHSIIAPVDGMVRTVFKKPGESVAEGEPILELVNTSRVKVEGYIHLRDLDSVQVGSVVSVQLDIPDVDLPSERLLFSGRIAAVDVKVEPVTHLVKVWAEVSNQNGVLRDGLSAKMVIDRHQVDHKFAAQRQSPVK